MRVEAFSEGKYLDAPQSNEDQFLILPGRGYAVFDGATDISGRLFAGRRGGWHASRIAMQAVAEFLLDATGAELHTERLIERISTAMRICYAQHGILDAVRSDRAFRFGATLTLAADLGLTFRFVLIGDSGLRINGAEVFISDSGLDLVTASLRVQGWRLARDAGAAADDCARVGRAGAFFGAARLHPDMQPWLDETKRRLLYERSLAWCRARLPAVPEPDIRHLLDAGIGGQARFANNLSSPLSYAVLDGFDIPLPLVQVFDRPRADLHSIELFTDGYFKPGATPVLSEWEAAWAEVERLDPEKIEQYPSVKGSGARMHTDDRTVVIVQL